MYKITKTKTFLWFAGILFLAVSCKKKDDESETSQGAVKFSLNNSNSSTLSKLAETDTPSSLLVTIKDADGDEQTEELPLYTFSGNYISEPLDLATGNYTLEGFHVLDADDEVIYSTPLASSDLAYLVENPLAVDIIITTNNTTLVTPEVIPVEGLAPTDLGYSTFNFEIVGILKFWVEGYLYEANETNLDLTTFSYSITPEGATTLNDDAEATTNAILVRADEDSYELSFEKEGFYIRSDIKTTYTHDELAAFTSENPLKLVFDDEVTEGLVAHYPLDGNGNDVSGNELHAEIKNASETEFTNGYGNTNGLRIKGNSGSIDSSGGHIEIPFIDFHNLASNQEGFTVNLWVKEEVMHNSHGEAYFHVGGNNDYSPYEQSYIEIGNFNGKLNFIIANNIAKKSIYHETFNTTGGSNTWQMYTLSFDSNIGLAKAYVNGELKGELETSIDPIFYQRIFLGRHDWNVDQSSIGSSTRVTGAFDDVRFYNRAITEKEVSFLYNE